MHEDLCLLSSNVASILDNLRTSNENAELRADGVDIFIRQTILAFSASGIARLVRSVAMSPTTPASGHHTNNGVLIGTDRGTGSVASDITKMLNRIASSKRNV